MRKKSHISLAGYLIDRMQVKDLDNHRKAFYIGSILPDLKPSFLTKRHTINETFEDLIREIKKITVDYDINKGINGYYARHLGVITHYLSDYCTYPHNDIFEGSMKDHVYYEKDLKFQLRKFIERDDMHRERSQTFHTYEEIINFIKRAHKDYLKAIKAVNVDVQHIIDICYRVVDAILMFLDIAVKKWEQKLNMLHPIYVEHT